MLPDHVMLERDGAQQFESALAARELSALSSLGAELVDGTAGERLFGHPLVAHLTGPDSTLRRLASKVVGPQAWPVRAVMFDKSAANNWQLGWHQDRTICVRARADVPGFGPFTVKQCILHVQPPAEVIAGMVTLRAHLDPVDDDNAPLLIAKGSHQLGLVPIDKIAEIVARSEITTCRASPGDVWAYHTLILHASDAAARPRRRRVLQVDFAAEPLPAPLDWLGV
jgi:Phytanoyl-CoA dioxygenase (PhyH)